MIVVSRLMASVALVMVLLFAGGTAHRIDQLESTVEQQRTQIEQDRRQIAQLNGRVFLGTDIPDMTSGRQR